MTLPFVSLFYEPDGRITDPPLQHKLSNFVKRPSGIIGLGFISNGTDGFSLDAVFGVVAKQVDIIQKIVLLLLHFLHDGHGGDDIIHSPVGVDHLTGEAIGINPVRSRGPAFHVSLCGSAQKDAGCGRTAHV